MSVIDYVGRQVDQAAFQGFSDGPQALLRQALADPGRSGQMLTGIIKLGQRFLLELLTEQGSMPFLPTRGSTFLTEARLGLIRSQQDLRTAFARALVDIRRTLTAEDAGTARDDEKFGTASILAVAFTPGRAQVSVRLTSLDPAAVVILPVSVSLH